MPKFPSVADFVGGAKADPTRPVGSYDVSGFTRGAEKIAEATQALGKGISNLGTGVADYSLDQQRWDYATAHSDFLSKKINLDAQYAQDTNYGPDASGKTMPERYKADLSQIKTDSAKLIGAPAMRGRFETDIAPSLEEGAAKIDAHVHGLQNNAKISYVEQQGNTFINQATQLTDGEERRKIVDTHNQQVDELVAVGAVTPVQALQMKQTWAERYAIADAKANAKTDPEGVINRLRAAPGSNDAVDNRMMQIEGSGKDERSSAVGGFIESTWLDLMKSKRPDLTAGKSDADILALRADTGLRKEMTGAYREQNTAYLKSNGIEVTPGSQYLAHFLGPAGAAAVLKANPNKPVADVLSDAVGKKKAADMISSNPTILNGQLAGSVKQWADSKMGGGGSIYDILRPDVRAQLIQHAETMLANKRQEEAAATQLDQYNAKEQVTNDVSSMLNSGQGIDNMDAQRLRNAFGDKGVAEWQAARTDAHAIWLGTHDLPTLNDQQIEQRLSEIAPKPGADNFARQQKVFDAIQSKAEDLRKQRAEDPAGSVQADPIVKAAAQGYDKDHPESFQPLAAARLAAQEKAGIPEENRSPITKQEAIDLTVPLRRMLPGQERDTITEMAKNFQKMFGENADTAFEYALRAHKVDTATAQVAARVMKKLGLGSLPDLADTRAADNASEVAAADKAIGVDPFMQMGQDQTAAAAGVGWPKPEPGANVPLKAIKALRDAPELAGDFDKKYGAGTSKKILEGYPIH